MTRNHLISCHNDTDDAFRPCPYDKSFVYIRHIESHILFFIYTLFCYHYKINHSNEINDCFLTKNSNYAVFLTKQSIYYMKKLFAKRKNH